MKKTNINKGDVFNNYTVIEEVFTKNRRYFKCKCECGNIKDVGLTRLKKGNSKHCNKCQPYGKHKIIHNMSSTKFYKIYKGILERCKYHKDYGGRGIKNLWNSFKEFKKDMYDSYEEGLSIERMDNNGNYCKENCKWIPMVEQSKNKQNSVKYKGKLIRDICRERGLNINTVFNRINNLGWDTETALNSKTIKAKIYNGKNISERAKEYGIKRQTLNSRINILGMTLDQALNYN